MVGVDTLLVLEHNKGAFTNYVGKILTVIDHLPTFLTEFLYCYREKSAYC